MSIPIKVKITLLAILTVQYATTEPTTEHAKQAKEPLDGVGRE